MPAVLILAAVHHSAVVGGTPFGSWLGSMCGGGVVPGVAYWCAQMKQTVKERQASLQENKQFVDNIKMNQLIDHEVLAVTSQQTETSMLGEKQHIQRQYWARIIYDIASNIHTHNFHDAGSATADLTMSLTLDRQTLNKAVMELDALIAMAKKDGMLDEVDPVLVRSAYDTVNRRLLAQHKDKEKKCVQLCGLAASCLPSCLPSTKRLRPKSSRRIRRRA